MPIRSPCQAIRIAGRQVVINGGHGGPPFHDAVRRIDLHMEGRAPALPGSAADIDPSSPRLSAQSGLRRGKQGRAGDSNLFHSKFLVSRSSAACYNISQVASLIGE